MANLEIRSARPEDRAPILAFSSETWSWGDYIPYVWDEWLQDPAGRVLVATLDGQPVGMVYVRMLTTSDAWLQGLRVAPQFRRQGIAGELNQAVFVEAMQRGAQYIRLVVDAENTDSIRLWERAFMRTVGGFSLCAASPTLPAPASKRPVEDAAQLATASDLDEIIDYLNASNIFPLTGGLYYANFTAYPITAELLQEKIAAQQVYLLRRWGRLDGLAIAEVREERQGRQLSLGYIDGTAIEPISLLAYDLRRQLPALGTESVRAYVPDILLLRDAFTGVEYDWNGNLFFTYERRLE
jgi:ribosomal protein S18 acetylase RimI-like enzyme